MKTTAVYSGAFMKNIKKLLTTSSILLLALSFFSPSLMAISQLDRDYLHVPFYDPTESEIGCSTRLSGSENAEKVWNYFISKGLEPHQAAGFMGNMQAEAHFEPRLVEYGWLNSRGEISKAGQPSSLDDNVPPDQNVKGQPGYGIIQWTSPGRKQGLRDTVAGKGLKASDLGLQLDYMWQELTTGYKASTLDPVMASTTVVDATNIVMENYEIPGNFGKQRPIRQAFAQSLLTQFSSGATTEATTSTESCVATPGNCPTKAVPISETVVVKGVRVHPCISEEVSRILDLAEQQGLDLSGGGWRSNESQIALREKNYCGGANVYNPRCKGSPPTAVPGLSRHERGTAVDFTCDGDFFRYQSSPCYVFLKNNTSLVNFPKEAWHWSVDGR